MKPLIKSYHQRYPKDGCRYYTVIDKKNARLRVYKMNGELVWEKEILTGKRKTDERIRWTDKQKGQTNNATPAGIFSLGKKKTSGSYYLSNYEGNLIDLIPEDGAIQMGQQTLWPSIKFRHTFNKDIAIWIMVPSDDNRAVAAVSI